LAVDFHISLAYTYNVLPPPLLSHAAYGYPPTAPQIKTKRNPPPASPIDPVVWAQPHISPYTYIHRGRKDTGNLKQNNQIPKRRDDKATQSSKRKTSHRTSPKASHTFQHLLLKRRSIEATARSSPYPPRKSDTAPHSTPAAAAQPRCVRSRGKQGTTGPWSCVAAGTGHSKAAGAHSGVLSGSRGCCTGVGGRGAAARRRRMLGRLCREQRDGQSVGIGCIASSHGTGCTRGRRIPG
jgi:hypothetical protein